MLLPAGEGADIGDQGFGRCPGLRGARQGGSLLAAAQVINFLAYGVLGRSGAPFYAAVNWAGRLADRAIPNPLFCHNFACLAEKPLTA